MVRMDEGARTRDLLMPRPKEGEDIRILMSCVPIDGEFFLSLTAQSIHLTHAPPTEYTHYIKHNLLRRPERF